MGWFDSKRGVFRFVGLFAGILCGFYAACATDFVRTVVYPAYLRLGAKCAGGIIGLFEDGVIVAGQSIVSPRYQLMIERGCDALEPSVLLIAGICAYPSSIRAMLVGTTLGTLCLSIVNIARIVSLYYIGVYWPRAFRVMHVDMWQAAFVLIVIVLWIVWVARQERGLTPNVPVEAD